MEWICQLGDGYMLSLDNNQIKKIKTGYPYPDTTEPQFDMLNKLFRRADICCSIYVVKDNLKLILDEFNKVLSEKNSLNVSDLITVIKPILGNEIDTLTYHNDDMPTAFKNSFKLFKVTDNFYCFYGTYNNLITNLESNNIIDDAYSSYNRSDRLILLVPNTLKNLVSSYCDFENVMNMDDVKKFLDLDSIPDFSFIFSDSKKFIIISSTALRNKNDYMCYYKTRLKRFLDRYFSIINYSSITDLTDEDINNLFKLNLKYISCNSFDSFNKLYGKNVLDYFMDKCKLEFISDINKYVTSLYEYYSIGSNFDILIIDSYKIYLGIADALWNWKFKYIKNNLDISSWADLVKDVTSNSFIIDMSAYLGKFYNEKYHGLIDDLSCDRYSITELIENGALSHYKSSEILSDALVRIPTKITGRNAKKKLLDVGKDYSIGKYAVTFPEQYSYLGIICSKSSLAYSTDLNYDSESNLGRLRVPRRGNSKLEFWLFDLSKDSLKKFLMINKDKLELIVASTFIHSSSSTYLNKLIYTNKIINVLDVKIDDTGAFTIIFELN